MNNNHTFDDPLNEEKYSPVKGLIHKYKGRALILLTSICSAYCRFCDRKRLVGDAKKGLLTTQDLENIVNCIKSKPDLREIIFSGGDPLTNVPLLIKFLEKLSRLPQIKIFRIHTRMPVSDPTRINKNFLKIIGKIKQPVYIGIHFNHPDEITPETIKICEKFRKSGCILFSHTIFLKNINDNVESLEKLFNKLIEIGVRPYYLLHCEPIRGGQHFVVDMKKERSIATELRRRLSGIACPLYVIDTPQGSGKIPIPLEFWNCDINSFQDFEGKKH